MKWEEFYLFASSCHRPAPLDGSGDARQPEKCGAANSDAPLLL